MKRNEAESAVEFLFGSKAFRNAKLWTQGKSDLADLRDLLTMDSSELRLDDKVKIVAMLKGQMLYAKHDYGCSAKTIVNELNDGVLGSLKADKVIKVSADKIRQINEATGPVDVQDKNILRRTYDIVTQSEGSKGLSNEKQSRTVQLGRDQKIAETLANIITEYESQIKTELEAGSRT